MDYLCNVTGTGPGTNKSLVNVTIVTGGVFLPVFSLFMHFSQENFNQNVHIILCPVFLLNRC